MKMRCGACAAVSCHEKTVCPCSCHVEENCSYRTYDNNTCRGDIKRITFGNMFTDVCDFHSSLLKNTKEAETVDHPSHYGGADNPYEHVKVAEALGWDKDAMIYNCTKYLWRLGRKAGAEELEDLRKAAWYLNRKIQQLEKVK